MGVAALASPLRIRRDVSQCIDCDLCTKACPSALPVAQLVTIRSAECTGCLQCVAACPAAGALSMSAPGRRQVPAWAVAALVATLFAGVCGYARWSGHCRTDVPARLYYELNPRADEVGHPYTPRVVTQYPLPRPGVDHLARRQSDRLPDSPADSAPGRGCSGSAGRGAPGETPASLARLRCCASGRSAR